MLIDARQVSDGATFSCDLCIVGAGPAGIAIANALRYSGISIILLESGSFDPELATQALFRGDNVGKSYFPLDACRLRFFGGSSNVWGGWCRPLDPIDFTIRDWMPHSGWPIGDDTLQPYYGAVAELLQFDRMGLDPETYANTLPVPLVLGGTAFENILFQYSPPTNVGTAYCAQILAATNIRTVIYANLKQMLLESESRRVGTLEIGTLTGRNFTVQPKAVVLATGGIENARYCSRHGPIALMTSATNMASWANILWSICTFQPLTSFHRHRPGNAPSTRQKPTMVSGFAER